jgi:hypothetical protein
MKWIMTRSTTLKIFESIRSKRSKGMCEKISEIDINTAIELDNDFKQLVMDKFRKAVENDGHKSSRYYQLMIYVCLFLEVKL